MADSNSSTTAPTTATIAVSGRQYRVRVGDTIVVNRMAADVGAQARLEPVLLLETGAGDDASITSGSALAKASVGVAVQEHLRGSKIRVFKMRRRKKSRRTMGHRQDLTRLVVQDIKH